MNTALVLTTIGTPSLLYEYAENFEKFNHWDTIFIIVGDRKTPESMNKEIAEGIREKGFDAEYWSIRQQENWMGKYQGLAEVIPYDSDNRRNLGFLIAADKGVKVIISIDDDNYIVPNQDYLKYHKIVGTSPNLRTVRSVNSWFNPCSMLEFSPNRTIYPRGFPYSKRWKDSSQREYDSGRIVLNLGLWTGNPDVDAVTNLNEQVCSTKIKSEQQLMLARGTFAPINTQNTAFHRDILPCYYYVLMGAKIDGLVLDRYGDIWSGLFAKKVIDQMDDRVTAGMPLTDHRRNPHDLFSDLKAELWGMILNECLVQVMESTALTSKTYPDAYLELADEIEINLPKITSTKAVTDHFKRIVGAMRLWVEVCEKIL